MNFQLSSEKYFIYCFINRDYNAKDINQFRGHIEYCKNLCFSCFLFEVAYKTMSDFNLDKYIFKFDKYILKFGQIYIQIWTNTFFNLDKYNLQFEQI